MSAVTIAGLLLIAVPLAFNVAFGLLAARFDYPDVLREPTGEVLAKFRAGGTPLVLTWWAFALTALLMVPVPYLARVDADPAASPARREALDIVFQAFNRYLGVAVGEHLGYLLTGAWTTLTGIALTDTAAAPGWLGILGLVIGPVLMLCSLEFVGSHEPTGWKLAERLTPPTYIAWSLWLIATGVAFIV
jgi:hypothetical protein